MRSASPHPSRSSATSGRPPLDSFDRRENFPILARKLRGYPLAYLDNAATTQKPRTVLKTIETFYTWMNANPHRGVYQLCEEATAAYEQVRGKVKRLINAQSDAEILFVRGTTEAINLVAHGFSRQVRPGDEILITWMEHHSNIVPWQRVRDETGAVLRIVPVLDDGSLDMNAYENLLSARTRIVAVTHVSNVLGTINPIKRMVELAHYFGAQVLVDGAQAAAHIKVDVQEIGCDYYAFSGHKLYGPTGVGVLYGKQEALERLPPYQLGGDMIRSVSFEKTTYNDLPWRFEAGTPDVCGVVGLGAAIDYLLGVGIEELTGYERELTRYALMRMAEIPGLKIFGPANERAALVSFVVSGIHAHDVGTILDQRGVQLRTGHHCCQPLMDRFGQAAMVRASFAIYNTSDEVDRLVDGIRAALGVFR